MRFALRATWWLGVFAVPVLLSPPVGGQQQSAGAVLSVSATVVRSCCVEVASGDGGPAVRVSCGSTVASYPPAGPTVATPSGTAAPQITRPTARQVVVSF